MAKSKEDRILDQFLNEEKKREYRNRDKDPMEMALAEQREAHTIMYEQPAEKEDEAIISWEDAKSMYQESMKNQGVVEEPVVESLSSEQVEQEEPVDETVPAEEVAEQVEGTFGISEDEKENVDEKQESIVNPVINNPTPTPDSRPVEDEDEEHTGSFGQSDEPEEDVHNPDDQEEVLKDNYLGGPEKLQRWLKTYAIEGALSQPQVASPFAGIKSVDEVNGYSCKSVHFETGNKMFVGGHRIDYSNNEQKAPTLQEALTMVRMGQMNGWTSCRLKGSPELNKQLFIACKILGMPVKDFVPTEEMLKEANAMQAAYNPSEASSESRLINRVADLDQRFDVVDSYAKGKEPSFESVQAAHDDGHGPFGIKGENLHISEKEQKNSQEIVEEATHGAEEDHPAEKVLTRDEINKMDLTPVDGKYTEDQAQAVSQLYGQYHEQVDANLASLTSRQNAEEAQIAVNMSDYTRKIWDSVEQLAAEGKPLTKEQQKMQDAKNAYLEECEKNEVDSSSSHIPSEFWPDRAKKVASEQKHKVALKYMYATETAKSGLVSLMGMAVKTPSKLQEQDYQIGESFPNEDFSKMPVSEQLKQIGKMRADTIKKEAEVQKTFGKMTGGKQLTSVTGKYQSDWAQDSDKQFDNQVKKSFFGKYSFRDEGR